MSFPLCPSLRWDAAGESPVHYYVAKSSEIVSATIIYTYSYKRWLVYSEICNWQNSIKFWTINNSNVEKRRCYVRRYIHMAVWFAMHVISYDIPGVTFKWDESDLEWKHRCGLHNGGNTALGVWGQRSDFDIKLLFQTFLTTLLSVFSSHSMWWIINQMAFGSESKISFTTIPNVWDRSWPVQRSLEIYSGQY